MSAIHKLFIVSTLKRENQMIQEVAERLGFNVTILQNSQELKSALFAETPDILVFDPENDSDTLQLVIELLHQPIMSHMIILLMTPKNPMIPAYFKLFKGYIMACITYPFHKQEVAFFLEGLSKKHLGKP